MKKFEDIKPAFSSYSTPEQSVSKILNEIERLYNKINFLEEQLEPYRQGTKDNEIIQKLEKENRELRNKVCDMTTYSFTEEEIERGEEWCARHFCRGGCSGGNFTWAIIPTGLGVIKEVTCTCGDSLVIEDLM